MTFIAGEKCFAKVKGYPPWPARINVLPPDVKVPRGKFPIFFYGTYEVCFLPSNAIFPYEKFKKKYGTPRSTLGFNKGLDELENNSTILQYGSDPEAIKFLDQFYDFAAAEITEPVLPNSEIINKGKQNSLDSDIHSESSSSNLGKSHNNKDSMSPMESESKDVTNPNEQPLESESKNGTHSNEQPLVPEIVDNQSHVDENIPPIVMEDCGADSSHNVDNSDTLNGESTDNKCHINGYANDFTNLLLEIRKYSWSKTRSSLDLKRVNRKNKLDNRIRLFYPWFDSPKKK